MVRRSSAPRTARLHVRSRNAELLAGEPLAGESPKRALEDDDQENSAKRLNSNSDEDFLEPILVAVKCDPHSAQFDAADEKRVETCSSTTSEDSGRDSSGSPPPTAQLPRSVSLPYVPGDLLWVKMGNYRFWPCMVTYDAQKQYFRHQAKFTRFHVRFFGKTDTFGWTHGPKRIIEFAGKVSFDSKVESLLENCTPAEKKRIKKFHSIDARQEENFIIGLSKAYDAFLLPREERLKVFNADPSEANEDLSEVEEVSEETKNVLEASEKEIVLEEKLKSSSENSSDGGEKTQSSKRKRNRTSMRKVEHGELSETVCSSCLGHSGENLKSCKCGNSFHLDCVPQETTSDEELNCAQCQSQLCAICQVDLDNCAPIAATCCKRRYHLSCLRSMALHVQYSNDNQTIKECPRHVCVSCRIGGNLIRCVKCPIAYHRERICVSASSQFLTPNHILCLRHAPPSKKKTNLNHCFVCREAGSLICCDICPAVVHAECASEDAESLKQRSSWFCPDCVEARFPVFGQICWGKYGRYPWWPVRILHPSELPEKCLKVPHQPFDVAVFFFGCPASMSYAWLPPSKVFLYALEDSYATVKVNLKHKYLDKAIAEAKIAFEEFRSNVQSIYSRKKPPKFRKIGTNRVISESCRKRHREEVDTCSCKASSPCVDVTCTNRAMYVECSDDCVHKDKCQNRRFRQKAYKATKVFLTTDGRGWGLQAAEDLKKGDFVIEYVGEIIDTAECDRRQARLHEIGDRNVYFLESDSNYIIDAGPAGNEARFINHSCEPNLRTEKWTVNGKFCIGLFANRDIEKGEELTFNYNMQFRNVDVEVCLCNAPSCSGLLGNSRKPKSPTP